MEGSLKGDGGRFNIGRMLNPAAYTPFPSLYVAEDFPTAFRECYGLDREVVTNGLTADELVLRRETSFTSIALEGRVDRYLDVGVMPQNWKESDSFVEIQGTVPESVRVRRLDGKGDATIV
jgi:hypothetical protein